VCTKLTWDAIHMLPMEEFETLYEYSVTE
jgi:hypothetical protein